MPAASRNRGAAPLQSKRRAAGVCAKQGLPGKAAGRGGGTARRPFLRLRGVRLEEGGGLCDQPSHVAVVRCDDDVETLPGQWRGGIDGQRAQDRVAEHAMCSTPRRAARSLPDLS